MIPETPWQTSRWLIEAERNLHSLRSRLSRLPHEDREAIRDAVAALDSSLIAIATLRNKFYSEVQRTRGHIAKVTH